MAVPKCPKHKTTLVCPACIAERGRGVPKPASARNGRLGGRPRLPPHNVAAHAAAGDVLLKKRVAPCAGCEAREKRDAMKRILNSPVALKRFLHPPAPKDPVETVAEIHRAHRAKP